MAKKKRIKRATISRKDKLHKAIVREKHLSGLEHRRKLENANLEARAKAEGKTVAQLIVEGWQ